MDFVCERENEQNQHTCTFVKVEIYNDHGFLFANVKMNNINIRQYTFLKVEIYKIRMDFCFQT